jgi:hypothetical protein
VFQALFPAGQIKECMAAEDSGTQFTCFTGAEVQILTPAEVRSACIEPGVCDASLVYIQGTQITCVTGTEVPILTQKALQ